MSTSHFYSLKFVKWKPLQPTEQFNLVVSEPTTGHSVIVEAWEE